MATVTMQDITFILSGGTAAAIAAANPTPSKLEMVFETDTGKWKIGNGTLAYNSLPYVGGPKPNLSSILPTTSDTSYEVGTLWINQTNNTFYTLAANNGSTATWVQMAKADDLSSLGYGDMLQSEFAKNAKASQGYVDKAIVADALSGNINIALSGDVEGTASTNLSGNVSILTELSDSGVTAGSYTKVTVNSKGLATAGTLLAEGDIPSIHLSKIIDAGSAAAADLGTGSGNVPSLDSNGKLPTSVIPPEATEGIYTANTTDDMIAGNWSSQTEEYDPEPGDICVLLTGDTYKLVIEPFTTIDNWVLISVPSEAVLSVNGQPGPIVNVTSTEIPEGANKYYTDARVQSVIGSTSVADLADGANVLMATDTLILKGHEYV
ncbi:hypothetical protein FACS1894184_16420 [Clostridia bacterium]|nr:hypothetical protein FACS1894184_16420 [Clostridia bacterium]